MSEVAFVHFVLLARFVEQRLEMEVPTHGSKADTASLPNYPAIPGRAF